MFETESAPTVQHVKTDGSDKDVVNAARVSHNRSVSELSIKDTNLLGFLARNNHSSPFRHVGLTLRIRAPLMVARQHWRYAVGSAHHEGGSIDAWNEQSRRYTTEDITLYEPKKWRLKSPKHSTGEEAGTSESIWMQRQLKELNDFSHTLYTMAIDKGIDPEQARLLLPGYAVMVSYIWSASLQSLCHFLNERLAEDAQAEIQEVARQVLPIVREEFPFSTRELLSEETRDLD